ncbi:MAG TPA: hypothetical protein EYP82_03205 [Hydrogenothermaceae bacterium]|nr:hypothetical protein [Hydrogenothermaceae bacterium]
MITSYFVKYFKTAVHNELLFGNNGKLLPKEKISITEALLILRRIKNKFHSNYSFTSSRYETPESLDLSSLYHKTIGFEYEPRYYKPNATPIDITSISSTKKDNYYILTVNSKLDTSNGASGYYWWSTDKGYFKEVSSSSNYKTVHFYPMSTQPRDSYHITVNGGDNLGYVDSATKEISASKFSYPEDKSENNVLDTVSSSGGITFNTMLVANKLFSIDLSSIFVKKSNIELGIDQVTVTMIVNSKKYQLFHGTPNGKMARFVMGDYPDLYGNNKIKLEVEAYSQAKKFFKEQSNMTYVPQFSVRGKVYNAVSGKKVTAVMVGGTRVALDENGEFYHIVESTREVNGLEIRTKENSEQNHFDSVNVNLA